MMQLFRLIPHVFCVLGIFSTFDGGATKNVSERTDNYNEHYNCMCGNHYSEPQEYANRNFLSAVEKLRCCHGSTRCKLMGKSISSIQHTETCNNMLCFSDVTCLANAKTCALTSLSSCTKQSTNCSTIFHQRMNISNEFGDHSFYKCFWMKFLNNSMCLLPECTDFTVVERKCDCQLNKLKCMCQSTDNTILPTYALFFSFKDVFITAPKSYSFMTFMNPFMYFLLSTIVVSIIVIIYLKFPKPLKAFTYGRILRLLCCGKTGTNIAMVHADAGNPNSKIENIVLPSGDKDNSDAPLPTYDEAMKAMKMLKVEPPPKYEAAI